MRAYRVGHGYDARLRALALELYAGGRSCRGAAAELKRLHPNIATPSQETVHQWAFAAGILRDKTRSDEIAQAARFGIDYDAIRAGAPVLATEKQSTR
jgi:hypothetical protein